jgi:pyruvate formate lyase activating enzyme
MGLVFDIRSFSVHDGPGIRTAVFLKGCPLQCLWCHNPESRSPDIEKVMRVYKLGSSCIRMPENIGKEMSVDQVIERVEADRLFFEESGGGVTLSGGEPLKQIDFTTALLKEMKNKGIHTALDTSGFAPANAFEAVFPFTDIFLFDLKLADERMHVAYTGKTNRPILSNLQWLSEEGASLILRIPLVENITDTVENLDAMKGIISKLKGVQRIDLLPYHCTAQNKYERLGHQSPLENMKAYDRQKAEKLKELFVNLAPHVSVGG